jgi:broad specificity phosphatase PhoE
LGLAADTKGSFRDDSSPAKAHESLSSYWERTRGALHKILGQVDHKGHVIIVAHVLSGAIMRHMLTSPSVSSCPGEEVIGNLPGAKVRPTAITCLDRDEERGEWMFAGR